jgi:putative DNA primase/helicase
MEDHHIEQYIGEHIEDFVAGEETRRAAIAQLLKSADETLTDRVVAAVFISEHGNELRYCPEMKAWLVYEKGVWVKDMLGRVKQRLMATTDTIYSYLPLTTDLVKLGRRHSQLLSTHSRYRLESILGVASDMKGVRIHANRLDQKPMLLNVKNGTVDLETGEFRVAHPNDLLTKQTRVMYDPDAECPRFIQFLDEVFCGNRETIAFIQRSIGYTLTGSVREKAWWFCFGPGDNGKTQLVLVEQELLGGETDESGYWKAIDLELVLQGGKSTVFEKAELRGARLVTTSEPSPGRRFDEGQIKFLTGMEPIRAARKFEHPITFRAEAKIWFQANTRPTVKDMTPAFWTRLKCVPFNRVFVAGLGVAKVEILAK